MLFLRRFLKFQPTRNHNLVYSHVEYTNETKILFHDEHQSNSICDMFASICWSDFRNDNTLHGPSELGKKNHGEDLIQNDILFS
jgi:hypothetical protein